MGWVTAKRVLWVGGQRGVCCGLGDSETWAVGWVTARRVLHVLLTAAGWVTVRRVSGLRACGPVTAVVSCTSC